MAYIIRPAVPGDLPALVRLCIAHAAYERSEFQPEGKEDALRKMIFSDGARLHALVVEQEGAVVGYATFSVECSTWDADLYMHMDCLFLVPEVRSQGLGRELMKAIAVQALSKGIVRMQWQTPSFNVDAIRFYDRMGPVKKEKVRLFLGEEEVRALAEG